jgi:hypothetical protein
LEKLKTHEDQWVIIFLKNITTDLTYNFYIDHK